MPDLDPELLDRAVRWCADAGRQVGAAEVRRALAPLGWDELLAVRALLADPPPARPLGPHALADLARGAPPDVAAEREREGRYRDEPDATPDEARPRDAAAPPARRRRARGPGVVIRRARDRAESGPAAPAPLPPLHDLRRPEGRTVLERLVRRHGARRAPIVAALAAGWTGPGGAPPGDPELTALLDHHGLARAFARRERDELLHALRAAGGVRTAAADRLGIDVAALDAALDRLGATADAERIREERRAELRARATLAERVRLLLADAPRLRDLDLLDELERDLRARLPEHVRALRAGGEPVAFALGRSLSLAPPDAVALAARFGLDLGPAPAARPPSRGGPRGAKVTRPPGARAAPGFAPRAAHGSAPRAAPRGPRAAPSRGGPSRGGLSFGSPSRGGGPRAGPPGGVPSRGAPSSRGAPDARRRTDRPGRPPRPRGEASGSSPRGAAPRPGGSGGTRRPPPRPSSGPGGRPGPRGGPRGGGRGGGRPR